MKASVTSNTETNARADRRKISFVEAVDALSQLTSISIDAASSLKQSHYVGYKWNLRDGDGNRIAVVARDANGDFAFSSG